VDVKIDKTNRRLEVEQEVYFTDGKCIAEREGILPISKKNIILVGQNVNESITKFCFLLNNWRQHSTLFFPHQESVSSAPSFLAGPLSLFCSKVT
jgi:hypothetical protein